LEIVVRLMNGDRVPAIAESLFLSPSTVRNHLSAVFRKMRVSSQQELIHRLRRTDGSSTPP
jgi:DNA-binding CsgD family transcriptional regulator